MKEQNAEREKHEREDGDAEVRGNGKGTVGCGVVEGNVWKCDG